MYSSNALLTDSVDPEMGLVRVIIVTAIVGLVYLISRFAFKSSRTHATTKISLDPSGVVRIYSTSPVNSGKAPGPASDPTSAAKTEANDDDFTEVRVVQDTSHHPAAMGTIVAWLVVLEIAKWIWWLL
jgi:hypothetical protein